MFLFIFVGKIVFAHSLSWNWLLSVQVLLRRDVALLKAHHTQVPKNIFFGKCRILNLSIKNNKKDFYSHFVGNISNKILSSLFK